MIKHVNAASRYLSDERGAAAAELAIFALVLTPVVLNLVDVGMYVYQRMQVENAAQAAAQAAWASCTKAPATGTNCPNLSAAVTGAVRGTSLGNLVTWSNSASYTSTTADAGYYCPDGANNALTASTSGATCTSTSDKAGYYARISVSYNYTPIFTGATIASLLTTPMAQTTWIRIE